MSNNKRIYNVTRGFTLKYKQAVAAIDNCAADWVEEGVSIRDLTLAESIAARVVKAKLREPLPYAELHGVRFEPPAGAEMAHRASRQLVYGAYRFCQESV